MKIRVNGIELFYRDLGEGIPLVLLHGYPLNNTIWDAVAELLQGQARLILPDLRGFGLSSAPEGVYSMRQLAGDVARLLDTLEIHTAVMAGHSMGGYVTLAFAKAFPDRLAGLGMVCSQAGADSAERKAGRLATADEVARQGTAAMARAMAEGLTADPTRVNGLEQMILQMSPFGVIGALKGMAEREDFTGFLPHIEVPALVLAGEMDAFVPLAKAEEMALRMKDCRLVRITGAGHMPMLEAPKKTAAAFSELLERVPFCR
jgi:pimeloyl-ACP methyl ester carboxylesterase